VALGKGLPVFSDLAAPKPLKLMSSKAFPGGRGGANLSADVNPSPKARLPAKGLG
jgi:hypothetical protein